MTKLDANSDFTIQSYYFFNSGQQDPVAAFEKMTKLQVNRRELITLPIADLETSSSNPQQEFWHDSIWNGGWSHITFGTVSTAFGIGILCLATGPVGWITGALAIIGGTASAVSGIVQLNTHDPKTKELYHLIGDVSLSLNNIPGLAVGTGSYVFTQDINQSITYANIAGIASGGASLLKSGFNAYRMQRLYGFRVGLNNSSWSPFTRNVNAKIIGINPIGLEGSHLVPQRTVKAIVQKAPIVLRKPIENFFNGPLCIHFMQDIEHALVDPKRWRFLPTAQKEILKLTNPLMSNLMENYPQIGGLVGIPSNLSPTLQPVATSLVITGARTIKYQGMDKNSSRR